MLHSLGVPFAEEYAPRANFFNVDIASEAHSCTSVLQTSLTTSSAANLANASLANTTLLLPLPPLLLLPQVLLLLFATLYLSSASAVMEGGTKLAVEVDGPQHFSGEWCYLTSVAYRNKIRCTG